ncbi:winged helix-turn-helix transcriptional regulator [Aestuariivita boseongensis]|uniref:winged helix-turn-helix transcriptional regulator n=1 Tax=Aestuariivita boseongensis TaxID=1470562 RepID=UPI001FE088BB|nr:winged helix-turn-helix transcriptional regulator [Aestuariivita boseongensis]
MSKALGDDTRFRLLRRLEQEPELSQREMSSELGLSPGAVNYVPRALVEKAR